MITALATAGVLAILGLATALFVSLVGDPEPATPTPDRPPAPRPQFDDTVWKSALNDLDGRQPGAHRKAITELKPILQSTEAPREVRAAILQHVAAFVRDHAPAVPAGGTYAYCLQEPPLTYPSEIALAMEAIGARQPDDTDLAIDLTGVNLAFANLQNLDLRNVQFDGALICRGWLGGSNFEGATFRQADLRFSYLDTSVGLSETQLIATESLAGTHLTQALADHPSLQQLLSLDPGHAS